MMERYRKLVGGLGVIVCAVGLVLGGPSVGRATTLQIDANGILTGATGVNVNGAFYDVQFSGGTCAALFNGCDQASDLVFTDATTAFLASAALASQVFLDVPEGAFDSQPLLTNGCNVSSFLDCQITTPYGPYTLFGVQRVSSYMFGNYPGIDYYASGAIDVDKTIDSVHQPYHGATWAIWRLEVASVPEPGSLSLLVLGLGLLALVDYRWRQRHQAGAHIG
ncbi:MAG: PEP-CTERM sorting domain-containing protein [Nitrospira sp.]|nr:PEP-CTERM sorting domain-containing protein [Nitrospira sp.]